MGPDRDSTVTLLEHRFSKANLNGCQTYTRGLLQNRLSQTTQGLLRRESLYPKAGIIPLDHQAEFHDSVRDDGCVARNREYEFFTGIGKRGCNNNLMVIVAASKGGGFCGRTWARG